MADTKWPRDTICWSVWSPRTSFEERHSSRLKAYNKAFADLIDVANPGNRTLSELVPHAELATFLSEEARADCIASAVGVARANDAFYLGQADQAAGVVTHVSRVGRLHYVAVREVCVRIDGVVQELIVAEIPLQMPGRPAICYGPYLMPLPSAPSPLPTPAGPRAPSPDKGEISWIVETPTMKTVKKKRIPQNFCCATCGATATPEARHGPQGPATLCNRCGIRWAKKREQDKSDGDSPPRSEVNSQKSSPCAIHAYFYVGRAYASQ